MRKIYFTWDDFDLAIDIIAHRIRVGKYNVSTIYGVPRGGIIAAVALSHRLKLPVITTLKQPCLVVDDVSDSGNTLSKLNLSSESLIATIHFREGSKIVPDVWVCEKPEDSWIIYPWENKED